MQHDNPQTYSGGTGGGSGSQQPDPLGDLEKQIQELNKQIKQIQDQITGQEGDLKAAEAELEQKRSRKKELDVRKGNLQRLVDGSKNDQQKIAQLRLTAAQEAQAARQDLDRICQDLEDALSEDYREEIDQAIEQVDQHIQTLKDDQKKKQDEVAQAETALANAKAAAAKTKTDLEQAQSGLRGLPGRIQSWSAMVKKALGALKNAYDRGQAKEAYLLADELEDALDGLERLLDPAYEQALTQKVEDAWTAYQGAGDAIPPAETTLKQRKDELTKIESDLKDYTDNRRQKIEDLLNLAPPVAPAVAAAPSATAPAPTATPASTTI